jgi:anti-sigma regulatory factor (Ser/Thr protein kinase)
MRPRPSGEPVIEDQGFVHRALIYESGDEFLAGALPFIEEGVRGGEPVLIAVKLANVEALRQALGTDAPGVRLLSVGQWYENSARTRDKFATWVSEHAVRGRARLVYEPPWAVGWDSHVRDWARHESVLNVAFAGLPLSLICPYDARELPAQILQHAECTHPELVRGDRIAQSARYEDPWSFCGRLDSEPFARSGSPAAELTFELAELPTVRRLVKWEGLLAGMPEMRVDELVLGVNEIATNALVHGRSPATLRIWNEGGELVFEVADSGTGIDDALAGQLGPGASGLGGRGLWLTRMMSDAVEIHSHADGAGTIVAIHATLDPPSGVPEEAGSAQETA